MRKENKIYSPFGKQNAALTRHKMRVKGKYLNFCCAEFALGQYLFNESSGQNSVKYWEVITYYYHAYKRRPNE